MSKKTYAQTCIELAEKATPGPWKTYCDDGIQDAKNDDVVGYSIPYKQLGMQTVGNTEFIAASRQTVPELAKRLEKACILLREIYTLSIHPAEAQRLAEELERMPE